jgi:hypothetical protein
MPETRTQVPTWKSIEQRRNDNMRQQRRVTGQYLRSTRLFPLLRRRPAWLPATAAQPALGHDVVLGSIADRGVKVRVISDKSLRVVFETESGFRYSGWLPLVAAHGRRLLALILPRWTEPMPVDVETMPGRAW